MRTVVQPLSECSRIPARGVMLALGAAALLCGGCVGGLTFGDKSLESVTAPSLPYPTAVGKQTTKSPPSQPARSPSADAPQPQPRDTSSTATQPKPAAVPPPQWPVQSNTAARPIPLPEEKSPIPLGPHDQAPQLTFPAPTPIADLKSTTPSTSEPAALALASAASAAAVSPTKVEAAPQNIVTQVNHLTTEPAPTPTPAQPSDPQPSSAVSSAAVGTGTNPPQTTGAKASPTPASAPAKTVAANESHTPPAPEPENSAIQVEPVSLTETETPTAAEPLSLEEQRRELIAALEAEVRTRRAAKAEPAELARLELQLRLLYLAAERPDEAIAAIDALPAPERESVKHLMFGLSAFMAEDDPRRATHRNAKVLRSLRDATDELAAGSRLDLKNVTFCEKVEYFGWYTEFPRAEFRPKQQVILYVEVENFAAEAKGPQSFETELQGSYQIFDASGAIIAERKLPLDREVCRNYRRDYFLAYRVYMPDNIAPGSYQLELTLEDLKAGSHYQGRKLGQTSLEFSIRP